MTQPEFRVEVSSGLVLRLDDSNSIVLESDRPVHTITHVDAFKAQLDNAVMFQRVRDENPPTEIQILGAHRGMIVGIQPDGPDWSFFLTDCCLASAKGSVNSPTGTCCRNCFEPIDPAYGGILPADAEIDSPLLSPVPWGQFKAMMEAAS